MNLRQYLINIGFELDTYYNDNKEFVRKVEAGTFASDLVYVRIFDESNKLLGVRYVNVDIRDGRETSVTLYTIDTFERLDNFLTSILP